MKSKTYWLITKSVTIILALFFGIMLTAHTILMENTAAVNAFLGAKTQDIIEDESGEEKDTTYYKSQFNSVAELKERGRELIEDVVAEGSVLLKNEGALPLQKNATVSLFSTSSVDLVYYGAGSGSGSASGAVNLKTAFEASDVGLKINEELWNWYTANLSTYGRSAVEGVNNVYSIKDAPWSVIPNNVKNQRVDAAIFVLARKSSEGVDLAVNASLNNGDITDMTNGDALDLSPNEITVLKGMKELKDAGTIGKIIVLMNSTNQVQTEFVNDPQYGIDAFLWCGTLGTTGSNAIADLLVGNVNPSGRLNDTFWARHRFNPVYANYGSYIYSGSNQPYVVYQEGIYNGYRYTETRYEDKVMNKGNAGDFDYYEAVSYPFGYGLSYTSFSYSGFKVTPPATGSDIYRVSVTVTNTGKVAGKEVVQVYLQKPYTEYDKANHIEKAAVELVAFDKTKKLDPNESQTLTLEVEGKYFASYDSYKAKTYILEDGLYYLTAAKNAHAAVNNILAQKGKHISDGMTEEGDKTFVYEHNVKTFDDTTYSTSTKAMENHIKSDATKITNQFDNADINLYDLMEGQSVEYVTRNNWVGTVKYGLDENNQCLDNYVRLSTNSALNDVLSEKVFDPQPDDIANPVFGSTATQYNLIDLRAYDDGDDDVTNDVPIEYDNPMWDDFLNQLSWRDMTTLLSTGFRLTMGISSINKPLTIDQNGSVGFRIIYGSDAAVNRGLAVTTNDPDKNNYPPAYPCNGIVAATYNIELIEEYGRQWGEDGLWAGCSGLYGPGANGHRSAYCGRNFEYYSEDPYLGGNICAQVVSGMMQKGVYAYLKHAVLNEQELSRHTVSTWANEQTIREVYLRHFEIAIEVGGATNVMTGYNKIGAIWTGVQGFCNKVLRDEFGMTGFAVTDYISTNQYTRMPGGILRGQDLPDQDYSVNKMYDQYASGYGEFVWAMRESVHRILYTVVHSNAMNGFSSNTRVVVLTPTWVKVLNGVTIASGVLFGISAALFAAGFIVKQINKKKGEKQ